jgi:NAD(P)-dependent dehydrogenase (short-subunit alcohol dehydrogenase family)
VKLRGVFYCMKHELRRMREQGSGVIVNCSSQGGFVGIPGLAAYTASKHGVIGLTKAAALEYAPKGIRISAICPGPTETSMVAELSWSVCQAAWMKSLAAFPWFSWDTRKKSLQPCCGFAARRRVQGVTNGHA